MSSSGECGGWRRPESVLVVVYTPGPELLLLERVRPAGFWQSVTGSLLAGETAIEAARRELAEETGFDVDDLVDCARSRRFAIAAQWRARFAPGVTENLEHEFRICLPRAIEPRFSPDEHRAWCWLPPQDALARATSWTNREAIALLAGLPLPLPLP